MNRIKGVATIGMITLIHPTRVKPNGKMIKIVLAACLIATALAGTIPQGSQSGLIVGGTATSVKEVPYVVALLRNANFFCGGSVVAERFVVTAAHCVETKPKDLYVRAGSSKTNVGGQYVKVSKVHVHPKYNPAASDYDVAVLELSKPFVYGKTLKPVALTDKEPEGGSMVRVSGWGRLKEGGLLPDNLMSVVVPVVDHETCFQNYFPFMTITDRMVCAGVEGKDSCQGDSGGPLVQDDKLVGVVSFGLGCARKDKPGVYTNVANKEVKDFLLKHVEF